VQDEAGQVLPRLTPATARRLVSSGVAHGGMQAKLEAALLSLEGGLAEVIVAPGQQAGICQRLLDGENLGTRLALEAV
jgi:acetylglutamate kinase